MNNKMTNCKVCGQEIAKSAKACPHCGAKNKKKHPILICFIILFVIFFLIVILASSGDSDEPENVENAGTSKVETSLDNDNKEEVTEKENEFHVGETAELKGVSVTLVNVTESTGSQFNTPTDGNVFVLCEFEIANDSDKDITVSSMLSFEAYCDDYTCTFSLTALLEKGNKNQLDGTVAAGKKFNGVIGYEVPEDWKELEVKFTPDFWSGKDIVFVANK